MDRIFRLSVTWRIVKSSHFGVFAVLETTCMDCHGSLQQQLSGVPLQATSHTSYPDDPDQYSYPNPDSKTDDNKRGSCFKEKAAAISPRT